MIITLGKLRKSAVSLSRLTEIGTLPIKKKYWLARLIDKAEGGLIQCEKERVKLVKKYGEGDEEKGWQVTSENLAAFAKEESELYEIELDLEVDLSFSIDELDSDKITAADFVNLKWLITDPE